MKNEIKIETIEEKNDSVVIITFPNGAQINIIAYTSNNIGIHARKANFELMDYSKIRLLLDITSTSR